ncbi:MAG TPA: NUDIX hydrolase [Candidatus Limiplasma sp.]|nr:NUDIX hydrolase [Candidatus Limiplasma sp.]HRX08604.1 NUDIX hydrolase [Candidatus Limiplasma sp.]
MNDYIASMRAKIGHDRLLLVGAGVFVHQNGRLLLQRRRDDDTWGDHGGSLELGETPEDTARRELLEETGLTAGRLEFLGVYSGPDFYHTYPNGDQVYYVGHFFLCEEFTGTPLTQTDETVDLQWFPIDSLPQNIMPIVHRPLADCVARLKNANVSRETITIRSL